jgi:hypothetical protein
MFWIKQGKLRNYASTQQVPVSIDSFAEVGHVETTYEPVSLGHGRAPNQVPRSEGEFIATV